MNRRKRKLVPKKINDSKRQSLSWHMTDCDYHVQEESICVNHFFSDGDDDINVINVAESESDTCSSQFLCDGMLYKLKLNDPVTVESSVGLLGSVSGVYLSQESLQRTDGKDFHSKSFVVVKLCKPKQCKRNDLSPVSNESCRDITMKLDFAQVNATIEQIYALGYLQTKGLVSLILSDLEGKKSETHSIELFVYLNQEAISKVTLPNEDHCLKKVDKMMKVVMEWLHGIQVSTCNSASESPQNNECVDKLESLFDALKEKRISEENDDKATFSCETMEDENLEKLQHHALLPSLRHYQKKSVRWMIDRETFSTKCTAQENRVLHPLWKAITHVSNNLLAYYNPFTGRISSNKFYHKCYPSGGILADEMGLGKTVEVLACILNHPMVDKDNEGEEEEEEEKQDSCDEYVDETMKENNTKEILLLNESPLHSDSFIFDFRRDPESEATSSTECSNSFNRHYCNSENTSASRERLIGKCIPGYDNENTSSSHEHLSGKCTTDLNAGKDDVSFCNYPNSPNQTRAEHGDVMAFENVNDVNEIELVSGVPRRQPNLVDVEKERLVRCICGENTAEPHEDVLKCSSCSFSQHSSCVGIKQNSKENYVCPECVVKMPIMDSRATLIISPVTIARQWLDEIHRHVLPGSLGVLVYEGVSKQGFIYPSVLSDNDIILTTYDVLKRDFHHLATRKVGDSRSSRHQKRYVSWPCPLTCIKFWRICLDEAQMVESTTAKAAETALYFHAVHRWCVTGTPIQRGVEDIYGLLLFLGVEPYYQKTWWKKLLYEPFLTGNSKPLLEVLYHIMWRTAKKDVINEINLPEQKETVKWSNFSPVEEHFYRRQHEECSSSALKELNKFQESMTKLNSLDKNSVQKMLGPLLRLRQACCHPQAVRGGFLSFQKSTITMDQLLETLIAKAKQESEEAHRLLLCAVNGLAGTYVLQENWQQAVDTYREAMRSWRDHEELIKTDSLQKLHTLHNLHGVLNQGFNCSRTLRDDSLRKEASELSAKYLEKWQEQVKVAEFDVANAQKAHSELKQKVDLKCPWWVVFLQVVLDAEANLTERLVEKVKDDLASLNNAGEFGSLSMTDSFSDLRGLQFLLITKLDAIEKSQNNLNLELKKLCIEPSVDIITSAAECCLRPTANSTAQRCHFCKLDDVFSIYESQIFGHQGVSNIDPDSQQIAGGLRGETETERCLKSIYNFLKTQSKHCPTYSDLQHQGQFHFEYLDSIKKNFKVYRQLWFALRERVTALDELEMCTMRLRLRYPGETVEENQLHIIDPIEIEGVQMRFCSDKVVANSDLRKSLGQLLYLKNLAKTQTKDSGENVEPCPVCTKSLGFQWSVFCCGHCLCCQCMWVLLEQRTGRGPGGCVKCPMCRAPTMMQEISYVSTVTKKTDEEKDIVVKGSHSTKIEAIVRTLLGIQNTDPLAKTLVFSTWQDVLEHIAHALMENDVKYKRIRGRKDFQENLEEFKETCDIAVLLLPLQSGSNGLNIIEATHVILVEPSLNPSLERQAVGRVHRIGQTKPTFIHRLLIGNTVEEKIMTFLQTKAVSGIRCGTRRTDKNNMPLTLGELASFFEPTEK